MRAYLYPNNKKLLLTAFAVTVSVSGSGMCGSAPVAARALRHMLHPRGLHMRVATSAPSKTERLRELVMMLENEIITQEEYASGRLAIIRS